MSNYDTWNVLAVDDEPDNLCLLGDIMEMVGAMVKMAESGPAALEVLKSYKPTVILLDLAMPNMDGLELRRLICEQEEFKEVPIIAVTAHAMKGDKEKALEAGFDGYISKPFQFASLLDEITTIVDKKRAALAVAA